MVIPTPYLAIIHAVDMLIQSWFSVLYIHLMKEIWSEKLYIIAPFAQLAFRPHLNISARCHHAVILSNLSNIDSFPSSFYRGR